MPHTCKDYVSKHSMTGHLIHFAVNTVSVSSSFDLWQLSFTVQPGVEYNVHGLNSFRHCGF